MNRRRFRAAALVGLLCLSSAAAWASGLQVAPISLTIKPPKVAEGLWLSNTGSHELHAQVRVFRWTQSGFEGKKLTASQELVVSPPIVDLAPGEKQLVRVIHTGQPPTGKSAAEHAYRLIINELPSPNGEKSGGINFIMQYSVPVFVLPEGRAKPPVPKLSWSMYFNGGHAVLVGTNRGAKHAHLTHVVFVTADGDRVRIEDGLFGYILPGATRSWKLKRGEKVFSKGGKLKVKVNGATVTKTVSLGSSSY